MICNKSKQFIYVMEISPYYHIFECTCCINPRRYVFYGKDTEDLEFYDFYENFIVYNN